MEVLKISVYLLALILANFIVLWLGKPGLVLTAFILIPFDFVMRAYFHETWKGKDLFINMFLLIASAGVLTYILNPDAKHIAIGSATAFICAQTTAGILYQALISKPYFVKVNGSDLAGILVDSVVFQWVAFHSLDWGITWTQTVMKVLGGLAWYYIIFKLLQLPKRW